jgi:hypothetical protein
METLNFELATEFLKMHLVTQQRNTKWKEIPISTTSIFSQHVYRQGA